MRVRQAAEIVARASAVSLKQNFAGGTGGTACSRESRPTSLPEPISYFAQCCDRKNKDPDLYVRTTTSPTSRVSDRHEAVDLEAHRSRSRPRTTLHSFPTAEREDGFASIASSRYASGNGCTFWSRREDFGQMS